MFPQGSHCGETLTKISYGKQWNRLQHLRNKELHNLLVSFVCFSFKSNWKQSRNIKTKQGNLRWKRKSTGNFKWHLSENSISQSSNNILNFQQVNVTNDAQRARENRVLRLGLGSQV